MLPTQVVEILHRQQVGAAVEVCGWLRTRRDSGGLTFLEITDGSCLASLQVVADATLVNYDTEIRRLATGCSLRVWGELVASPAKGQAVEVRATAIEVIGWADPESYPLQKKRHSFEFLRSIAHLRSRTNALGAVAAWPVIQHCGISRMKPCEFLSQLMWRPQASRPSSDSGTSAP